MAECQSKDEIETGLCNLQEGLELLPNNMSRFSSALRSLFTDQVVGGDSAAAQDFRKLRDKTRECSVIYLKGILPKAVDFVNNISEFFENYRQLSFEEWQESLQEIRLEISKYSKNATILLKIHESILVQLKETKDQANKIVLQSEGLQEEFDLEKGRLLKKADLKLNCGKAFIGLPLSSLPNPVADIVGVAGTVFIGLAQMDIASAVAKGEEGRIHGRAATTTKESLIPALSYLISGLQAAAGFFSVMENELKTFGSSADKAVEKKQKLHYKRMKGKAVEIAELCRSFHAVLPTVRTNFEAIPTTGTDESYVDEWLKDQNRSIMSELSSKMAEMMPSMPRWPLTEGNDSPPNPDVDPDEYYY